VEARNKPGHDEFSVSQNALRRRFERLRKRQKTSPLGNIMARILLIIPFVVLASAASAQQQREHDACVRDVSRFCRAQMNDGDQVVLACLKQNRGRLSRACAKTLAEHGQ
jgi:hypothetical protein